MMATTKKNRDKVEEKVEVKKPVEIIPAKSEFPEEYLSNEHLLKLESMDRDLQNAKLSMSLEEQVLQNLSLKLELLSLNIDKQRGILQLKATEYNQHVSKFDEFKKVVWPLYGFSPEEGLGYNPMTGKIKR